MSDPSFTDPPHSDQGLNDRVRRRDSPNRSLWGWIAGIAVLALIVFAVIAGSNTSTNNNTSANNPAATTGSAPSTTGSGSTSPQPPAKSGTQ